MPYGIIEIRQVNNDLEPLFEVWERKNLLVPYGDKPGYFEKKESRKKIAQSGPVPPPSRWPIPADHRANLATEWAWYLEVFSLQQTPVTQIRAGHVRKAFFDWGQYVFGQLFSTKLSQDVYHDLSATALSHNGRMEIYANDPTILSWPWEGMVDNDNGFVGQMMAIERRFHVAGKKSQFENPLEEKSRLKILLVTAREQVDVDYRLIGKALTEFTDITLLNPPTIQHLKEVLSDQDKVWDVIHFDCHGGWGSLFGSEEQGYLLLGDGKLGLMPTTADQLMDALGPATPKHIVLNACRSAKAEAQGTNVVDSLATTLLRHPNVQDVTAMAYNLSVDAVKHFLKLFYSGLIFGDRTSISLHNGRMAMAMNPYRSCIGGTVKLQDWMVPVVYLNDENSFEYENSTAYKNIYLSERMDRNDRFIGRDHLFYMLDMCNHLPIPIWLLYGMTGQGKTTFLKHFLEWRSCTGDNRPAIWIDFEQVKGASEVFRQMAISLGQPTSGVTDETLQEVLLDHFKQNPYWIIWDHLHVVRPLNNKNLAGRFTEKDRNQLSIFIGRLTESKSTILGASRGQETWAGTQGRCMDLPLVGLDASQRWQFYNDFFGERDITGKQSKRLIEEKDAIEKLIFYLAGHPATMEFILYRFLGGETAHALLNELQENVDLGKAWSMEEKMDERLKQNLSSLGHPFVKKLVPFLVLFDELLDVKLLKEMVETIYGDDANTLTDNAFLILETAGLLFQRQSLHPVVGGVLRSSNKSAVNKAHTLAFINVINRSLNNPDYSPIFTIGTLSRAFFISINLKYSDHARNISAPMVNFYKQKEMYVEIYQTKEKVFKLLTSEKKDIAALGEAMDTLAIAREIRDVQGVNNWLPAVLELAKKRRLKLPEAIKVRLLYEQAKVAELLGNKKEYENLIIQAHAASNHVDDNDLTSFISFEMAQLALHSNSPAQAGEHLDEVEDNLLKGNSAIYRARAQAMMMEGDLDEARHLLQRAITLSKKEKNEIGKAMNISLMGEIEGKLGNREKAVKLFEQAVSIFEKAGDRHNAGVTYHQWAKLYYTEGLMEEAGEYFIHAALCFRDTGDSYTLEVVSSNFNYYLAELTDEGASFMFIKWKAAQLPDLMDIN